MAKTRKKARSAKKGHEAPGGGEKAAPGGAQAQDEAPQKPPPPLFDDLGPNAPSFEDFFEAKVEVVKDVQASLRQDLDDDLAVADRQIRDVERRYGQMKSILGWADSYLDVAEHKVLRSIPPRDHGWTDTDRKTAVAAAVARERRFRDIVRGLVESIQERISYGQSRMRAFIRADGQRA